MVTRDTIGGRSALIQPPRLVRSLIDDDVVPDAPRILCPWLNEHPRESDIWTSILAVHDINDILLSSLTYSREPGPGVYAGIFASDMAIMKSTVIGYLKAAGVGGVVNLPSVSFIDGSASETLGGLSLGSDQEIEYLRFCASAGLRVGGVVRSTAAAKKLLDMGSSFLLVHDGPPIEGGGSTEQRHMGSIKRLADRKNVPVFALSRVIASVIKR